MIDIHCHILPGIDDGAQNEQDAIEMAQQAVNSGINTVIATPHHKNRTYDNEKPFIQKDVKRLNQLFEASNVPLNVQAGQEVRIFGELVDDFKKGDIQTLNDSKYLLLEFPSNEVPQYTEQLIFDIQRAGMTPVIAHPERNRDLYTNPNRLYELVSQGALAQVTSGSLTGAFGKEIKQVSHQMIQANLIHFVASDAHNIDTRTFKTLKEAYDIIKQEYGAITQYSLEENAQYLIHNENINQNEPQLVPKKKKFFGLF